MFYGPLNEDSLTTADADVRFVGSAGSWSGLVLASGGDVNGDGYDDILIGMNGDGSPGSVYLFYGPLAGLLSVADADRIWTGEADGDAFGSAVGSVGGHVIVGATRARGEDVNVHGKGATYLLPTTTSLIPSPYPTRQWGFSLKRKTAGGPFVCSVSV